MAKSEGVQVVEELFQALRRLDVDGALALMSDDVVYQNVPFPADRGKARTRRTLKLFTKAANFFDVKMKNIAERDGVVLTERIDVIRGPLLDLSFWVCGTFEVKNGKITLWRDYFDAPSVLLQAATSPLRKLFS